MKPGQALEGTVVVAAVLMIVVGTRLRAADDRPAGREGNIIPSGAALEEIWNEGEFTEGVASAKDGTIYFSDIPRGENAGRVLKFDPATGQTTVHCADSGKSNGLMFDSAGRLIACCGSNGGKRALCEITATGQVNVLVDRFEGKRFNSPNDLTIHRDGSIYFSDPRYIGEEPMELDHQSVYRFVPATGVLTRVTTDISKPNGVILSPDNRMLYVAETDNGWLDASKTPPENLTRRMTLNSYVVQPVGSLTRKRVLVDFGDKLGIDGMTVDQRGRVFGALRSDDRHGIVIFTPGGKELDFLPTESLPTNCCFGRGQDASMLYVTAGGGLYRVRLNATGYHVP